MNPTPLNLETSIPMCHPDKGCSFLIEASAGTGKTYSITYLVLHALLQGIPIEKILIMTFTEAATQELKERIVHSLHQFTQEIAGHSPVESDLPLSCKIAAKYAKTPEQWLQLLPKMQHIITNCDRLQIYTIHGFCNKILKTYAFESGIYFDCELEDDSAILQQVFRQVFRHHIVTNPDTTLLWEQVKKFWDNKSIRAILQCRLPPTMTDLTDIHHHITSQLEGSDLIKTNDLLHFLTECLIQFRTYKSTHNLISYDDMIHFVYAAICLNHHSLLGQTLAQTYQVAFLDEFQDTDTQQYAIFSRIFNHPNHALFMIGDPKQSIYKFRGADLNTYFKAAENAETIFTLNTNFRSSPKVIQTVNKLFERKDSFGYSEQLQFAPTQSGKANDPNFFELYLDDQPAKGLYFYDCNTIEDQHNHIINEIIALKRRGKLKNQLQQEQPIKFSDFAILVATNQNLEEISKLLHHAGIPAVAFGEESVLNSVEAGELFSFLKLICRFSERHLKEVLLTSFFQKANTELSDDQLIAICDMFSELRYTWNQHGIIAMWYHFLAMPTTLESASNLPYKSYLARQKNGEQKLTNYHHLIEILNQHEEEIGINPAKLLQFLNHLIVEDPKNEAYKLRLTTDSDAVQLLTVHKAKGLEFPIVFNYNLYHQLTYEKKETDYHETLREKLRLAYVSLTRAKLCNYVYAMEHEQHRLYIASLHYLLGREEKQAIPFESFCTKKYNRHRVTAKTPHIDYEQLFLNTIKEYAKELPDLITYDHLSSVPPTIYKHPEAESMALQKPPTFPEQILHTFDFASFSYLTYQADTKSHYFTPKEHDEVDDEILDVTEPQGIFALPRGTLFGSSIHEIFENYFNVGEKAFFANTSQFIFSPMSPLKEFQPSNDEAQHALFEQRKKDLMQMICQTLDSPFHIGETIVTLRHIQPCDAIVEMEFYYTLNQFSADSIAHIFDKHGKSDFAQACRSLNFSFNRGYMTGFVDLLFRKDNRYFIIDWKTNYLGATANSYNHAQIHASMLHSHYFLQYHIYSVALHLYLSKIIPNYDYNTHFGGIAYIYVRGRNQDKGIYTDKPSQSLIDDLARGLTLSFISPNAKETDHD